MKTPDHFKLARLTSHNYTSSVSFRSGPRPNTYMQILMEMDRLERSE